MFEDNVIKKNLLISKDISAIAQIKSLLAKYFRIDVIDAVEKISSQAGNTYEFVFIDISFFDLGKSNSSLVHRQSVFSSLWENYPEAKIIALIPKEQNRKAICVVKAGADDYLTLPILKSELDLIVVKSENFTTQEARLHNLDGHFWDLKSLKIVETSSPGMREVYERVKIVADKTVSVLLTGETGVGKNVIAKLIHQHSLRKNKPFVAVHCGAITESLVESELFGHEKGSFTGAFKRKLGKFELANGGTLFLDEIGTISPQTQIKLLQALQDSIFQRVGGEEDIEVDIRVIAATNENLSELTESGKFRKDLFYRLNVFAIHIPPLRERIQDIKWLVEQFVKKYCRIHSKELYSIKPEVFEALSKYDWPGNIRELENLTERACILETTDRLQLQSFPLGVITHAANETEGDKSPRSLTGKRLQVIEKFEENYLKELLLKHKGKIKKVAEEAQLGERQIHKLLSKYEINGGEYRNKDSDPKGRTHYTI